MPLERRMLVKSIVKWGYFILSLGFILWSLYNFVVNTLIIKSYEAGLMYQVENLVQLVDQSNCQPISVKGSQKTVQIVSVGCDTKTETEGAVKK